MPSKPTTSRTQRPKTRFQMFIDESQLAALRRIEARTGARLAAQVRLAIDAYLGEQGEAPKREVKRAAAK